MEKQQVLTWTETNYSQPLSEHLTRLIIDEFTIEQVVITEYEIKEGRNTRHSDGLYSTTMQRATKASIIVKR